MNYFNTPSSFGFTTQSSYSPQIISTQSHLQLQLDDLELHKNQGQNQQHPPYRFKEIYQVYRTKHSSKYQYKYGGDSNHGQLYGQRGRYPPKQHTASQSHPNMATNNNIKYLPADQYQNNKQQQSGIGNYNLIDNDNDNRSGTGGREELDDQSSIEQEHTSAYISRQMPQEDIQAIYLGLTNFQRKKMFTIVQLILKMKTHFIKLQAFKTIYKHSRTPTHNKLPTSKQPQIDSLHARLLVFSSTIHRIMIKYGSLTANINNNSKKNNIKSANISHNNTNFGNDKGKKKEVLRKLWRNLETGRQKDLRIQGVFVNRFIHTWRTQMLGAFATWRANVATEHHVVSNFALTTTPYTKLNTPNPKPTASKSQYLTKYKQKLSTKQLLSILSNHIYCVFYILKHHNPSKKTSQESKSASPLPSPLTLAYSISTTNSYSHIYKSKSGNVMATVMHSSYTNYMGSLGAAHGRMAKLGQKIEEGRVGAPMDYGAVVTMLSGLDRVFLKLYRTVFNVLQCSPQSHTHPQIHRQATNSTAQLPILTSILKHMCWLSSTQSLRQKTQKVKSIHEQRAYKLNYLVQRNKRKQREEMREYLWMWNREALVERMGVRERVKELEEVKRVYIESYKE